MAANNSRKKFTKFSKNLLQNITRGSLPKGDMRRGDILRGDKGGTAESRTLNVTKHTHTGSHTLSQNVRNAQVKNHFW